MNRKVPWLNWIVPLIGLFMVSCASTDPQAAFDEVSETVAQRTGQRPKWMREDGDEQEIEKAVQAFLKNDLTVQSVTAITLLNNRSLQAQWEEIGISQAELAQASRAPNIEIAGMWRFPNRPPSALNMEYSAAANFLDLLMLPARTKIAKQNLEQTKLQVAHHILQIASEAQTAFYTLQAHLESLKRKEAVIQVNDAAVEVAQQQYKAGNVPDLELYQQQAAASQAQLDLVQAQTQIRSDREKLNRIMGLWGKETDWEIADSLPTLPKKEFSLKNLEELGLNQRLDLAAARNQSLAVVKALQLKKFSRYFPGATIGVSAERDTDRQTVIGPSLSLELPIFDQGQPALAKLAAQYRQAQRNFEALAINIRSEVREARDVLVAARRAVAFYEETLLPQHQKILRETLLQYNAMQKSNYDLLAAKEKEQMAQQGYIDALLSYWMARVELERVVGGRLTDDEIVLSKPVPATSHNVAPQNHQHH
ncbi:MAG: TolC family protein [Verrucomicrobiae bacterium]|nr:TolC family protein [Verrucomicrobiae bacterium]